MTPEQLIEEAKRRYPVGTKFSPAHVARHDVSYCIITKDSTFDYQSGYITAKAGLDSHKNGTPQKPTEYGTTWYNRIVYYNEKWADIIGTPKSLQETTNQYQIY